MMIISIITIIIIIIIIIINIIWLIKNCEIRTELTTDAVRSQYTLSYDQLNYYYERNKVTIKRGSSTPINVKVKYTKVTWIDHWGHAR